MVKEFGFPGWWKGVPMEIVKETRIPGGSGEAPFRNG
jgi:hypothetical protein